MLAVVDPLSTYWRRFLHLSTSSPSSSSPKVCHGLMLCCETTTKQEAAPCVPESSSNTNRSFITAVVNAQHSTVYLIYLSFVELQKIFIITLKRSPVLQYSTVVISMQEEERQIRTQAKMVISWINHDPFIRWTEQQLIFITIFVIVAQRERETVLSRDYLSSSCSDGCKKSTTIDICRGRG